jgi:hypothetical protein
MSAYVDGITPDLQLRLAPCPNCHADLFLVNGGFVFVTRQQVQIERSLTQMSA